MWKMHSSKNAIIADTSVHQPNHFDTNKVEEKGRRGHKNFIPESHRRQGLIFASPEYPQQTFHWQNTLQYIALQQQDEKVKKQPS